MLLIYCPIYYCDGKIFTPSVSSLNMDAVIISSPCVGRRVVTSPYNSCAEFMRLLACRTCSSKKGNHTFLYFRLFHFYFFVYTFKTINVTILFKPGHNACFRLPERGLSLFCFSQFTNSIKIF